MLINKCSNFEKRPHELSYRSNSSDELAFKSSINAKELGNRPTMSRCTCSNLASVSLTLPINVATCLVTFER